MSFGFFVFALAVGVFVALGLVASVAGAVAEVSKRRGRGPVVVVCRVVEAVPFACGAAFVVFVLGGGWRVWVISALVYFVFEALTRKASAWLLHFYDKRQAAARG